jgi:hypothetical protein
MVMAPGAVFGGSLEAAVALVEGTAVSVVVGSTDAIVVGPAPLDVGLLDGSTAV